MKNIFLVAGIVCIVIGLILFTLGYTNFTYLVGNMKVQVYPAAFSSLLGLVLFFGAYREALRTG